MKGKFLKNFTKKADIKGVMSMLNKKNYSMSIYVDVITEAIDSMDDDDDNWKYMDTNRNRILIEILKYVWKNNGQIPNFDELEYNDLVMDVISVAVSKGNYEMIYYLGDITDIDEDIILKYAAYAFIMYSISEGNDNDIKERLGGKGKGRVTIDTSLYLDAIISSIEHDNYKIFDILTEHILSNDSNDLYYMGDMIEDIIEESYDHGNTKFTTRAIEIAEDGGFNDIFSNPPYSTIKKSVQWKNSRRGTDDISMIDNRLGPRLGPDSRDLIGEYIGGVNPGPGRYFGKKTKPKKKRKCSKKRSKKHSKSKGKSRKGSKKRRKSRKFQPRYNV
jgi:hypothetical protein